MKISMEWLREYAPLDAPLEMLVRALVDTGTEVDRVHRGVPGVVVARVLSLEPIPESTRGVRLADIDLGEEKSLRVVTGAPNVNAGDLVPYAPPGTQLPGFDEPLGVRAMFGGKYQSPGMLLSEVELGIGEDAGGLLILSGGRPGEPVGNVLPVDVILDVEATTNRPDCLCHLGIARELAAAIGEPLREPATGVAPQLLSAASAQERVIVSVEDTEGCHRFMVRVIENCAVGPSPAWLQRRLRAIGLRPINNVVDVTNYVAHELGEPLHAFDMDRFLAAQGDGGKTARVVVRRGGDESVLCLDGVERRVGGDDIAVCAGDRVASIAGIIGGQETAVDEATRSVLLEAASWNRLMIRASSRRMGVRTDASSLFEKGLSDELPARALDRAASLIAELAGAHVLRDTIDEWPSPLPPLQPVTVGVHRIADILGYAVDSDEAVTALARLGFGIEQHGDQLRVTPPHFRRDITIAEDIVEEVGRSLGYQRVPSTLPGRRSEVRDLAPDAPVEDRIREICAGAGFDEAITWSFVAPEQAATIEGLGEGRVPIRLPNALSEEWSVLRTSTLPGLCRALAGNLSWGVEELRLFELGRVFWEGARHGQPWGATPDGADAELPKLPAEPLMLGLAAHADDAAGSARQLRHLQATVDRICEELTGKRPTVEQTELAHFHPRRAARLHLADAAVGLGGELHPDTVEQLGGRGRIVVVELRIDAVAPAKPRVPQFSAAPRFPAIVQDLAVVVPAGKTAAEGLRAVREGGGLLLEHAELYDEYRDPQRLGSDRKGWTFRLTYRAADRTLTNEEAQRHHEQIAVALKVRCSAEVRG